MHSSLFVICLIIYSSSASILESDGWVNIELFHALDAAHPDAFTPRGNVTISSLMSGTFQLVQQQLSGNERAQLKLLAEADKFYRLKAIITHNNGVKLTVLTSSKACAFAKSQLNDVLWVSLDYAGSVLGIMQTVSGSETQCGKGTIIDSDSLDDFNTDVFVKRSEMGNLPDTASFIQKMEREREARDRGEVKDNRGFFAKYWIYIVPVAILLLLSGASPDANAGGGGGGR